MTIYRAVPTFQQCKRRHELKVRSKNRACNRISRLSRRKNRA